MSSPARSALVKSNWINKIDLQIVWQNNICSQNKQLTVLCNKRVRVIVKINQTKRNETKRTAQKMKFFFKNFFHKCDQIRRKLETFTEEIPDGKLHVFLGVFFCSDV